MPRLATLIKLQKTRVDEQRLVVAQLSAHVAMLDDALARLETQRLAEQQAAAHDPALALTYGAFIRQNLDTTHDLTRQRQTAQAALDKAHDQLAALFEEQKRYEIAEAARVTQEQRDEAKRETQELDEIGAVTFVRRQGA